jgi:hypothetical protein
MEWKMVVAGCAIAAASACGDSSGRQAASPITVAGCLQNGNGDDFILTRINEPSQSVGTTGAGGASSAAQPGNSAAAGAGPVEREQLRSAAGAYRVDAAEGVKLGDLVGRQVRVVGTIKENMDLPRANADRDPVQLKQGDLARIEATSVSQIAAECSGAEAPTGATRTDSKPQH